MKGRNRTLTEEERKLIEEAERYMEEVNQDPDVRNAVPPAEAYAELLEKIRAQEAEHAAEAETAELLRLGLVYKKRRKMRKYLVLAAALVLALALGITSIGGGERIVELLKIDKLGRDQSQVNSDEDIMKIENVSEEEVWQKIEDEYGFYPVKFRYLPEGTQFIEAKFNVATQAINLYYEKPEKSTIIVRMYLHYSDDSVGIDVEDEIIEERHYEVKGNNILMKKYQVEDSDEERWGIEFVAKNVMYSIRITGIKESELVKIVNNLKFF